MSTTLKLEKNRTFGTNRLKKTVITLILCVCMCFPSIQIVGIFFDLPNVFAASSSGVEFKYKKDHYVSGNHDNRYHYLKKGKPTVNLKTLTGANSKKQVKIKLYKAGKYYGIVKFSAKGKKTYADSVPQGRYYLVVSGGIGNNKGWIRGSGTITPVYR